MLGGCSWGHQGAACWVQEMESTKSRRRGCRGELGGGTGGWLMWWKGVLVGMYRRENGGMGKGYFGPMDCAGKLAMVNSPGLDDMKVHLFCPDSPPARATVAIFKGGSSSVWTRHGPARFSAELSPTEQPFGKRSWKVKAGHSSHLLWRPEPNIHNTSPLPPRVPPPCSSSQCCCPGTKGSKEEAIQTTNTISTDPSKIHTTISTRLRVAYSSYSLLETTTTTTNNSYP